MDHWVRDKSEDWRWNPKSGSLDKATKGMNRWLLHNEQYLGNLLYRLPQLIPLKQIGRNMIGWTLWPGQPIDLIGLDENGAVILIETKLSMNREIDPQNKKNIFKQVKEKVKELQKDIERHFPPKNNKEWGPDSKPPPDKELIEQARRAIVNGDFLILLVTDNVDHCAFFKEELLRQRERGKNNIFALEVSCFSNKKWEIVNPRIFPQVNFRQSRFISKEEEGHENLPVILFPKLAKRYCDRINIKIITYLCKWVKNKRFQTHLAYDCPTHMDSFSLEGKPKNKSASTFYLSCYGNLRFRPKIIKEKKFYDQLREILGDPLDIAQDDWGYFRIDNLRDRYRRNKFYNLIEKNIIKMQ